MVKKEILVKLRKFKHLLEKEGIPVSKMLLYGSYARGMPRKDSDIDVCVISPVFGKDRFKERLYLFHKAPMIDTRIEPVAFSLKDYQNNLISPLLHQIRKEAVEIK
ncbi:MAG: nucleotidyltransferase domain-containing protein [Deltaproteobacteria bacterium]|nr:nucleotidyltransferase domain-containing protein [Deltaproteobacteria bacterium]